MRSKLFEKKSIWIVVTMILIFSMMLASCAQATTEAPPEPTEVPEEPEAPPEETEEPTEEPEEEMEPVTMTFWDPSTDEGRHDGKFCLSGREP